MDLKNEILKEHSKSNTIRVAQLIANDTDKFSELMEAYFDKGNMDLARKAAWIVRQCVTQNPDLIFPYLQQVIEYLLQNELHDAIKRNGLAIIDIQNIPENLLGMVTDLCFRILNNGGERIASKAFAMSILFKIGRNYPEINRELKLILKELYPYQSPGFQSRAKKILNS